MSSTTPTPSTTRVAWILTPLLLIASAAGVWVVFRSPGWIGAGVLGSGLALASLWMLSTSLWPASADRRCPACGENTLQRMDPRTTRGLSCGACGHSDPTASGWFLAEEEGQLDELVGAARRRRAKDRQ